MYLSNTESRPAGPDPVSSVRFIEKQGLNPEAALQKDTNHSLGFIKGGMLKEDRETLTDVLQRSLQLSNGRNQTPLSIFRSRPKIRGAFAWFLHICEIAYSCQFDQLRRLFN